MKSRTVLISADTPEGVEWSFAFARENPVHATTHDEDWHCLEYFPTEAEAQEPVHYKGFPFTHADQ